MHPSLPARFLETIRRHGMIAPGDRVAVAVSGGGDSVALLLLLIEVREALGVTLMVAHFNHQLRPEASDEDERFTRRLAGDLGLDFMVQGEDVALLSQRAGTNVEAEARERRYAFLRKIVSEGRATKIATGHTLDDQAETVLARLTRGSGLRGLAGIHPVLGPVVRPQLEIRRAELRTYLAACNQPWREDATNLDTSRLRARIRLRLLPVWEAEFGESVTANLARLADLARNDEALLEEVVEKRFECLTHREGNRLTMAVRDLLDPWPELKSKAAREALAARLVRRASREVRRDLRGLTADHVARVLYLARAGTSGNRLELHGGLVVERVLDRLLFSSGEEAARNRCQETAYSYLADPWRGGEAVVWIAETGKRLRLKLIDWPPAGRETYQEASGVLDADRLEPPLVVRNWLPGDAYRPYGRGHAEKLKRLLLERRIAGKDRVRWPVLTSAGRLVWTKGLPVAADFAAGPRTLRVLLVEEESSDSRRGGARHDTTDPRRASN